MKQNLSRTFITVLLCFSVLCVPALAEDDGLAPYPDELYLQQSRHGTCTLCSAAMMLRARLYLDGSEDALTLTEQDVASSAWCSDGLYWSWSYTVGDITMHVSHTSVGGVTPDELQSMLAIRPEGVVLYCGYQPHAVFLTDCVDGVFYCADPVTAERTPLADSTLGSLGTQEDILRNVTAFWYIESTEYAQN